ASVGSLGRLSAFLLMGRAVLSPSRSSTGSREERPAFSTSSNKIKKQRSRKFLSGITSRVTVRLLPFCCTRTFSLRAVLFSFLALLMAARSGSIHARERRVADQVLPGEHDHFADWL